MIKNRERFTIRPYEPQDRAAIRDLCCSSAYRNRGAGLLWEDEELFADYFSRYYTDFEPTSCLVVEQDGEFLGYLTGSQDSQRFVRKMATRIVPPIVASLVSGIIMGKYSENRTRRLMAWLAFRSWRETPPVDLQRYPVHYHANLNKHGRGYCLYSQMALRFLDSARKNGRWRMHGHLTGASENPVYERMLAMYDKHHPGLIEFRSQKPCTMFESALGESKGLTNYVYGLRIKEYQDFLRWMQKRLKI